MASTMIIYLFGSALSVAFFYLLERLFLRGSTLFYARRTYYIVAIVSSLLLPVIAMLSPDIQSLIGRLRTSTPTVSVSVEGLTAMVEPDEAGEPSRWVLFVGHLIPALGIIWGIGAGVMLIRYMYGHWSIISLLRRSEITTLEGATVYMTSEGTPFTYLSRIGVPQDMYDTPILKMVMKHELVHVRQCHYVDMVLGSVLQILQWWNPFAWALTALQKDTLEYIADDEVIRQGAPSREYQMYLLKSTLGGAADSLLLSFSMYNLKQRIIMMNKKKTTNRNVRLVYALITLPVMLGTMVSTQALASKATALEVADAVDVVETTTIPEVEPQTEVPPTFVGGKMALEKYLEDNLKYPTDAKKAGISGDVLVQFEVKSDGSVSNVKVSKSLYPSLDKEAIRVVSAMPKWNPGKDANGHAITVRASLRVSFGHSPEMKAPKDSSDEGDKVFEYTDDFPEFPGGQQEMMKFLADNVKYPADAEAGRIQGVVIVGFIIEKDGRVSNIKVLRGVLPSLDAEAVRVIGMMPAWKPGMSSEGKPVRFRFNIPMNFKLTPKSEEKAQKAKSDKQGEVFEKTDVMPEYEGGMEEMMKTLNANVVYPKEAVDKNIQGMVVVSFIVEKDGSTTDFKLIRGIDPNLDAEALRVVKLLDKWIAAEQHGKPVRCRMNVPVNFRLK